MVIFQFIPVLIAGIIAYFTFYISRTLKYSGASSFSDLLWMVGQTYPLELLFVFIFQVIFSAALLACPLRFISNHIIISLDILFFTSMLLLVLYHSFKDYNSLLMKKA